MAITLAPRARYMILCDEVLPDPQRPGKLMIVGLTSLIDWPADGAAPLPLEKLVVLLVLTDGRGAGMGRIVCRNEERGRPVFGSPPTRISFEGNNPIGRYAQSFQGQRLFRPAMTCEVATCSPFLYRFRCGGGFLGPRGVYLTSATIREVGFSATRSCCGR